MFVNGLDLEAPLIEFARAVAGEKVPVVQSGQRAISPDEYVVDRTFPRSRGAPNSHLWTNPVYALRYAAEIRHVLADIDPGRTGRYGIRLRRFTPRIENLDPALRAQRRRSRRAGGSS